MNWLALDIGGANLKLADGRDFATSLPFALWRDNQRLARELRAAIAAAPPSDHLVVSMTGELADCFENKVAGVTYILQAVSEAADGRHTRVYLLDGTLVSPKVALTRPLMAASSNWHALATFCGRYARSGSAWLVDIGSTTVDLVPLQDAVPPSTAPTDTDRLLSGELVYTGVERSPVCALVSSLPFLGQHCPVAQEVFATAKDAYLLLGDLPESPHSHHTADHQPATKAAACRRMRRMISASEQQFDMAAAIECARYVARAQLELLTCAARKVLDHMPQPPSTVVLSGHGEFLGRRLLAELQWSGRVVSLVEELGPTTSRCATAHALAVLAREASER